MFEKKIVVTLKRITVFLLFAFRKKKCVLMYGFSTLLHNSIDILYLRCPKKNPHILLNLNIVKILKIHKTYMNINYIFEIFYWFKLIIM